MWNRYTSTAAFSIGTIFNVLLWYKYENQTVRMICVLLQFILYMQFFEELSQIYPYANYGTFTFNMLQPIVIALVVMSISTSNVIKYVLGTFLAIYVLVILLNYNSIHLDQDKHDFDLYWWRDMSYPIFPIYILTILVSLLSIEPLWLGIYLASYIIFALLCSYILYSTYGSTLCWFITLAPLYTYLVLQYNTIQN